MIILAWVLIVGRVLATFDLILEDKLESEKILRKFILNALFIWYIIWSIIEIRGGLF